jgi:hypothetical protein
MAVDNPTEVTKTGIPLTWGKHTRDGQEHEEWHAPCDCAFHPEPEPHWHPCAAHLGQPTAKAFSYPCCRPCAEGRHKECWGAGPGAYCACLRKHTDLVCPNGHPVAYDQGGGPYVPMNYCYECGWFEYLEDQSEWDLMEDEEG